MVPGWMAQKAFGNILMDLHSPMVVQMAGIVVLALVIVIRLL